MSEPIQDSASGLRYVAVGATENPKHLLVMLHSAGTDYREMEQAAPLFAKCLPETLILIPDAPHSYSDLLPSEEAEEMKKSLPEGADINRMRSWFAAAETQGIDADDEEEMGMAVAVKVQETVHTLHDLIDAQLKKYNLKDGDLALYGFSQGGVLALSTGVDRYEQAGAVISHSGYTVDPVYPFSRPATLLIVGAQELGEDEPLQEKHENTKSTLEDLNVPVREYIAPGLGHEMNEKTMDIATRFIRAELGIPEPLPAVAPAAAKPFARKPPAL
jgi:phospholipase/carboxylesterase